jgi:hypothetical protein
MAMSVLSLPASAMPRGDGRALLESSLAVRYEKFFSDGECDDLVRRLYAGRASWTPGFEGAQYTVGRAWYTDLEEDRAAAYFAAAPGSDKVVQELLPGLQEKLLGALAAIVGGEVVRREGWCGPGVHIFPARAWASTNGGDVHFDLEGLSAAQVNERAPALTAVAMLQPPDGGGGLRLWDRRFAGEEGEIPPPAISPTVVEYGRGDLVLIDSYRLHQIAPFSGTHDRISATAHLARDAKGRWESWF